MLRFLKTRRNSVVILLVALFFIFGIYIGYNNQPEINKTKDVLNKNKPENVQADFSSFWKVWNTINEKYPGAKEITNEERVNSAVSGLVKSLNDPYSSYFNPKDTKNFEEEITGSFSGIGMEVGIKDKILTVIAPLKNTPAYKANIKPGDKVLKIGETITSDLSIEKAISLIRGEKGTSVTLTIFRDGDREPREVKIVRDIINIPTLDTELRKDGIFIIKLYSFSENSANLFRNALKEFSLSKTNKLILDLRGNPGGYLEAAVNISSWFLQQGKIITIEDYGNNIKPKIYRSAGYGYDVFNDKLKFIILINGGSASASEIVAGAMQDHGLAKLVGTQSFGKGSVQEVVDITPETILKITIAKWLTPNGVSISQKGLTPDYKVEFTQKDYDANKDPQMEKAIELLLE